MSKPLFSGSIVALVTPMKHGEIDFDGLKELVEFHIKAGTHAIVSVGTTGECSTLSIDENVKVIKKTVEFAAGRIPVIAGTGSNATSEAITMTKLLADSGVAGCLSVVPYYNKPTQEGLYQHYKTIAEAVNIPQILYNVPGRTGVDMHNDTVIRLADIDNIIGIKDATGNLERGRALIEAVKGKMDVYSGDDATAWQLILSGAKGNISVTANVAPNIMSQLCNVALLGDATEAHKLNAKVEHLHDILFCESNPIPVKWALYEMGLIETGIRLPLTPLAEQYRTPIRQALQQAGLVK